MQLYTELPKRRSGNYLIRGCSSLLNTSMINHEKEFEQVLNLSAKEACYIRRLLNRNEDIDTGELGNAVYLHL